MANYLVKRGYVSPNYKPDGESQTIQEKLDVVKTQGMEFLQRAFSINNIRKAEEIILEYQLSF